MEKRKSLAGSQSDEIFSFYTTSPKIKNLSKKELVAYQKMAQKVLGKKYSLSVVFCHPAVSKKLNKQWRQKEKPANVLSFPISPQSGEIFLDPLTSQKQADQFDMSPKKFLFYLFIHGLLHLKGYDHGSTMERTEKSLLKKFSTYDR